MSSRICLASLCGIPGSGKSSFCKYLLDQLSNFSLIWICFDEILDLNFDSLELLEGRNYKKERESLMVSMENLVRDLKQTPVQFLQNNLVSKENSNLRNDHVLILVDDCMFYKSMRYKVLQIARKFETGYFDIYFNCDLEKALFRNSKRPQKVPIAIIEKMHAKLEKPTNSKTLVVDSQESPSSYLEKIIQHTVDAIENPEKVLEAKNCDNEICQSRIHQIDIILRKEISRIFNLSSTEESTENLKTLAKDLNEKRKQLMTDIKTNSIEIPNNVSNLKHFLS